MPETPMITMWMGQNVDDMTREEAQAALKLCGRLLTASYELAAEMSAFHAENMQRRFRR